MGIISSTLLMLQGRCKFFTRGRRLFFLAFFRKIFSNMSMTERFHKMDPGLGAIHTCVKVTQLDAVNVGAKTPCHLADDAELVLTWQYVGAVTIGAKPVATDLIPCISFFMLSISRLF
jgi:hypothetical protein